MLILFTVTLSATGMAFLLGWVLLHAITTLNRPDIATFSLLAGLTAQGLLAFGLFLGGLCTPIAYWLTWIAVISIGLGTCWYRQRGGFYRLHLTSELSGYGVVWLALVATQAIQPLYTGSEWYGDWWMHYDISRFYMGQGSADTLYFGLYTVVSRTPLFNWTQAFFMGLFGTEFYIYQLTAVVSSMAFIPIFLRLMSPKRFMLGLFIIGFNPFIVTNILYPWPKLLTAAYLLASLHWFRQWQQKPTQSSYLWAWGGCFGCAMLTHPSALFYGLGMGGMVIYTAPKTALKQLFGPLILAGAIVLPWLIWASLTFGSQVLSSTPLAKGYAEGFTPVIWLAERILSFTVTFVPHALFFKLYAILTTQQLNLDSFEGLNPILWYYYHTLPGTLTTIMLFCLGMRFLQQKQNWLMILFACGVLGGVLFQPGATRYGLAPESMAPLTLMGLIVAAHLLQQLDASLQRLILLIMLLEFGLSRGLHTLLLAFNRFPPDDPNLLLKTTHNLIFARDMLGERWLIVGGVAISAYLLLIGLTLARK